MKNYLAERSQRTVMDGKDPSAWGSPGCGVPQGSVLGPLLFALYCADLGEHVKTAVPVQFADDLSLVSRGATLQQARDRMNVALHEFHRYATANRLAPQPSKTQLMILTPHKAAKAASSAEGEGQPQCRAIVWDGTSWVCAAPCRDKKSKKGQASPSVCPRCGNETFACELDAQRVDCSTTIKILGVLLDNRLSWEEQASTAAGKARYTVDAIKRFARYLATPDRGFLAKALALPHLDYCQTALAAPTALATDISQRAYKRVARVVTRRMGRWRKDDPEFNARNRSEPALKQLAWPTWVRRRRACAAAVACGIWYKGTPQVLRNMLPASTIKGITRSSGRAMPTLPLTPAIGTKAFEVWGPHLINAVMAGDTFRNCEPDLPRSPRERPEKPRPHRPPPDVDIVERRGLYAALVHKYNQCPMVSDADGRVTVWTDGSCQTIRGKQRAGAGVFYAYGNAGNCMMAVSGWQSNQRAELTALLHVMRTEERPVLVMTDSMYVHMGITGWRFNWRARAWFRSPLTAEEMHNADLWKEVDRIVEQSAPHRFLTRWCKAHALVRHVNAGLTTDRDIYGNNFADVLAGDAARLAVDDPTLCRRIKYPLMDLSDSAMKRAQALDEAGSLPKAEPGPPMAPALAAPQIV
eukprot:gene57979-biopygen82314